MAPKSLRATLTGDTAKKVSFLAAMSDEDAKGIITEAVDLLWEQKGQQVLESVQQISPVAQFIGEGQNQTTEESQ